MMDKKLQQAIEPISFEDATIAVGSGRGRVIGFGFEKESENPIKEEAAVKRLCQSLIPLPMEAVSETLPPPEDWPLGFIPPVSMLPQNQIRRQAGMSDNAEYEFELAVGRAYGRQLEQLLKEKSNESTRVSHELTSYNYVRGKQFSDGSMQFTPLANRGVVDGRKWIIDGEIWFKLKLWDPGNNTYFYTAMERLSLLDDDKKLEKYFSQYFHPVDERAYKKAALQTFRSRLFDLIGSFEEIKLYDTLGWQKADKWYFSDGNDYPLKEGMIASFTAPSRETMADINETLAAICTGISLERIEDRKRMSFLCCFGLTAWLGSLLGLEHENLPSLLLTGSESESRNIADCLLKAYKSKAGADILDIHFLTMESAAEYASVLRDDVLIVDSHGQAKHKSLLRSLVTNRSVYPVALKTPLVILQKFPSAELEYGRCFAIDLAFLIGYESLMSAMKTLRSVLLTTIEKKESVSESSPKSFEEIFVQIPEFVGTLLLEAGAETQRVEDLKEILSLGFGVLEWQSKSERPVEVEVFCQRFRNLVVGKYVHTRKYPQTPSGIEGYRVVWQYEDKIRVPADYMQKEVCFLLDMTASDFKRIRDWLLARGLLHANKGEEYTRRIQLPDGSRMRVYEFEAKLFEEDEGNVFNS